VGTGVEGVVGDKQGERLKEYVAKNCDGPMRDSMIKTIDKIMNDSIDQNKEEDSAQSEDESQEEEEDGASSGNDGIERPEEVRRDHDSFESVREVRCDHDSFELDRR
jgi:hypothetical protein